MCMQHTWSHTDFLFLICMEHTAQDSTQDAQAEESTSPADMRSCMPGGRISCAHMCMLACQNGSPVVATGAAWMRLLPGYLIGCTQLHACTYQIPHGDKPRVHTAQGRWGGTEVHHTCMQGYNKQRCIACGRARRLANQCAGKACCWHDYPKTPCLTTSGL